jgi:hypothetical protein
MYYYYFRKVYVDTDYSYDGERCQISGFGRNNKETITVNLRTKSSSTKAYIRAQLLLWGIVDPSKKQGHLLRDELAEMLVVGMQARGDTHVCVHTSQGVSSLLIG